MTSRTRILLGATSLGLLAGCGDPLVGSWESYETVPCLLGVPDRIAFEVYSDNTAAGDYCNCNFRFDWEEAGQDRYQIFLDVGSGCWGLDSSFECELLGDDDHLNCGNVGEYRKVD